MGLFACYAQWISHYSDKIKPLVINRVYPIKDQALSSFVNLKSELADVTLGVINEKDPLTVETDASDVAISATLNQNNRPVAFWSRSVRRNKLTQSSVEKEAMAIVEAIRKWSHLLSRKPFKLVTDQRSITYVFNGKNHTKIKNAKLLRWRIELSQFEYDIVYRAGKFNTAADTMSRIYCVILNFSSLYEIHAGLCHPGITRTYHFIKMKNLPYSIEEVRKIVNGCRVCAEIKPRFHKPIESHLIKATQPMERLSIDFKGPLPSSSKNKYLLTVVDEYSRFPFAFACSNIESQTVINCLQQIFYLFGAPGYVHSDRGKSFVSNEIVSFLHSLRIPTSKTSVYNPRSNGQCEKYNDIIWKGVQLSLKSRGLPISQWEKVLPQVLHSVRSLLCTTINSTPRKRFLCFQRRSALGISAPSWLNSSSTVLVRRHNRSSKYEPVVEEADLIHATPQYAFVRFKNGHESTVSLRDIAPLPDSEESISSNTSNDTVTNVETNDEVLLEENNKETDTETLTEKSFDAEMVAESSGSNSKMSQMKLYLYGVPLE